MKGMEHVTKWKSKPRQNVASRTVSMARSIDSVASCLKALLISSKKLAMLNPSINLAFIDDL